MYTLYNKYLYAYMYIFTHVFTLSVIEIDMAVLVAKELTLQLDKATNWNFRSAYEALSRMSLCVLMKL